MSTQWQYKVVVVEESGFGSLMGIKPETVQDALDQYGALGWELTAIYQPSSMTTMVWLYLKKPA
jgi:Domain of unknown function (DUF4177)